MDINKILLSGRVLNDPTAGEQFFVASNGQAVIRIQLLVRRKITTSHDKYDSGLISLIGFNKIAKRIYQNVKRGERLLITARFSLKEDHSEDIVIDDFEFLENKDTAEELSKRTKKEQKEKIKAKQGKEKQKASGAVLSSKQVKTEE